MSELNNIDRLFKEKFKDFEVTPSDKVWENISSRINEGKKETGLLSLWLKLCFSVAVFLIGFSVVSTFIAGPFGITNSLIKGTDSNATLGKKSGASEKEHESTVVPQDSFRKKLNQSNAVTVQNNEHFDAIISEDNSMSAANKDIEGRTEKHDRANHSEGADLSASETRNSVAQNHNVSASGTFAQYNNGIALPSESEKMKVDKIKTSDSKLDSSTQNNGNLLSEKTEMPQTITTKAGKHSLTQNGISESDDNEDANAYDTNFDPYTPVPKVAYEAGNKYVQSKETAVYTNNYAVTTPAKRGSDANDAHVQTAFDSKLKSRNGKLNLNPKGITTIPTDTLTEKQNKIAEVKTTEADKEALEKNTAEKTENKSKWIVSTNFSPVFLNLNGSGSTLDSKFSDNTTTYQTSMSYGVGLKYALSEKWSLKTGVSALNLEYTVNDISYYYSSNGSGLEYVNENANGSGMAIGNPDLKNLAYNDNGIVTKRYTGNLNHKINYVEVPVELTYKILNKKFGVEVIGGVSSLLLNDNKVALVSNGSSTPIGEANNLNKLHFSTNLGMGLRYSFMKDFQANMEPMLKYQINTYKNDAANFKPYFIGIYTGISYSF